MRDKIKFQERLKEILALAEQSDRCITIEEVRRYFAEDNLAEEQMELVFDYLLSQKIVIKGYIPAGGIAFDEEAEKEAEKQVHFTREEQAYLKEYLKDLEAVRQEADGERKVLFEKAAKGDALAKSRLVEIYLKEVVEIAKKMYHREVFLGDLVQEGNVGLLLGIDRIQNVEDAHETITSEIRQSIQMLIEEQTEFKNRDNQMVEKVNALDESIQTLTEDLGRKVTIEELALYTGMTEEEVEDILRLAGEEPEDEEEHEHDHHHDHEHEHTKREEE